MTSPTVSTCLWFDSEAEAAARFYVSLLPEARILQIHRRIGADGSAGPAFIAEFELQGQRYSAMNGGPHCKLTPAVSIQIFAETQAEIDRLWRALLNGGAESRCGWLTDRWPVVADHSQCPATPDCGWRGPGAARFASDVGNDQAGHRRT